ncbi:MAG: UvrD-helicase domain-containing protein, partial [Deltaproteobacteria bacterium]|nr:UvrD-helicase domain-containing protein [Deltaproteobacteria bacterium]
MVPRSPMELSHLNTPQQQAVTHTSGPLLVLAGAGSGKTRVITYRIAHLLGHGIPARAIVALTFTNKAAEEMRERIAHLLGNRKTAGELTMGTFHSLGLRVLKAERAALGFPRGFVIYDTSDQLGVLREILRRTGVPGRRFDVKAILTRISLAKNAFIGPEDYDPSESDEYDEITAEVYPRYQSALRHFAAVDFDDLIVEPVRLWQSHPEIAERWAGKYAHVLVDEFQDTNRAQLLMVKHLASAHENICVVGDDDQSIYSWRGADPRNILDFGKIYPGATIVRLEQNYRSTPTILSAANQVIAHNTNRHGKTLWSDKQPGEIIEHVVAPNPETEARFVAEEIDRMRESSGYRYKDFAVLYRSNKQTELIEEEMRQKRIPYVMFGGQQFFERKEVKDLIAYLRACLNPRDEISLRRIINYPARGIGAATLEKLTRFAARERTTLWTALGRASDLGDELRAAAWRAIHGFLEIMRGLDEQLHSQSDLTKVVDWLVDTIELIVDIRAASPSGTAAQRRIDNINAFKRTLSRYMERGG